MLLRKIGNNDAAWWVGGNDAPAECVSAFADSQLSLFEVTSEDEITRVAIAMLALRGGSKPQEYRFLVIPDSALAAAGVNRTDTPGDSPDSWVSRAHREVLDLRARLVGPLANEAFKAIDPANEGGPDHPGTRMVSVPEMQSRLQAYGKVELDPGLVVNDWVKRFL